MRPDPPQQEPAGDERPLWLLDDGAGRFGPLTDLCPVFALAAGGRTLRERIEARLERVASVLWVPEALAALVVEDLLAAARPPLVNPGGVEEGEVLAVSGRWDGLDAPLASRLASLRAGRAVVEPGGGVVGVAGRASAVAAWIRHGCRGLPAGVVAEEDGPKDPPEGVLVARPWDLLDRLARAIAADAEGWAAGGSAASGGVHADPSATLHPTAVLDASAGPVVVEAGARVHAFAWVQGPAWIGPDAVIAPHAQVRGPAAIGAGCKVGGEVKHLIVAADSNKAHGGYLGDALVGPWCNLGAGTTASNLKNTYGSVRVKLAADAEREDSGRTFQGPLIGAFVKTAIGTRLPTGCCVGTGACLAGSAMAPAFVPPMTFTTDAGVAAMEEAGFLRSLERQMARRGQTPGPALVERLRTLMASPR